MAKMQRTGLTEGSLIFNDWLKTKGLYRADTEDEFINWLYSTSGWYDRDIKGSYFDIDTKAVKKSENYQWFLEEFRESLRESTWFHLMLHSSHHLNGLELAPEFANQFSVTNTCFWKNKPMIKNIIGKQRVLVVSSIAPLIASKYNVIGYQTPQTHLNTGDNKNSWETLDQVSQDIKNMKSQFDIAIISFGAYGCLLADRISRLLFKDAITVGSGIYNLYPVGKIPPEFRPPGYEKIEDGRYWL